MIRNRILDFFKAVATAGVQFSGTAKLLGRTSAGGGDGQEVSLGTALEFSGGALAVKLGTGATQAAAGNHTHAHTSSSIELTGNEKIAPSMMGRLVRLVGFDLNTSLTGDDPAVDGFVIVEGPGTISGNEPTLIVPALRTALITWTTGQNVAGTITYHLTGDPSTILLTENTPDTPVSITASGSPTIGGSPVTIGTLLLAETSYVEGEWTRTYSSNGSISPPGSGRWFIVTTVEGLPGSSVTHYLNGATAGGWSSVENDLGNDASAYTYSAYGNAGGTFIFTNGDQITQAAFIGQAARFGSASPYRWFRAAVVDPAVWEQF